MKLSELINNLFVMVAMSLSAFGCLGCQSEEKKGKYEGKSKPELVSMVKNPREAQECIDILFKHDSFRENHREYYFPAKNGATFYSLEKLLQTRKGVCEDRAVAAAELLLDNGYSPELISVSFASGSGHVEFIYSENGMYGTAGTIFRPANTLTKDELATKIAAYFGTTPTGWVIYKLHPTIFNYSSEGLIRTDCFGVEGKSYNPGLQFTGTLISQGNGFFYKGTFSSATETQTEEIELTNDFFNEKMTQRTQNGAMDLKKITTCVQRHPNKLPFKQTEEEYVNNLLYVITNIDLQYDSKNRVTERKEDKYHSSGTHTYSETFFTYGDTIDWVVEDVYQSTDGDKIFERRIRTTRNLDGSLNVQFDQNPYDGVWD